MKTLIVGCGRKIKPGCHHVDCCSVDSLGIREILNKMPDGTEFTQMDLDDLGKEVPTLWTDSGVTMIQLPYPTEFFDRIEAEDVLEHCSSPIAVMEELGRVLAVGGRLWIRGPDWRCEETWSDLTHKRGFAPRTFDGFIAGTYDEQHYGYYHGAYRYKAIERAVERNKGLEWLLEKLL